MTTTTTETAASTITLERARIILLALCEAARHDRLDDVIECLSDDVYRLGVEPAGFDLPRLVCALAQAAEWGESHIPEPAISGMLRDLPWPTKRLAAKVRGAEQLALALDSAFKPFGSLDEMDVSEQAGLVMAWLGGDFRVAPDLLGGPTLAKSSQWSRALLGLGQVQWVTPTSGTVITCRAAGDCVELSVDFGSSGSISRAQTVESVAEGLGLEFEATLV